jgi:hypothetical protein
MNRSEPFDLHQQICDRIKLDRPKIEAAAREAEIREYTEQLISSLESFKHTYHQSRIYEELRCWREIYENRSVGEEYADTCGGDHGLGSWDDLYPPQVGGPAHDALLDLFWWLALFWDELPPKSPVSKKARGRWAPVFKKDWIEAKSSKSADEAEFREKTVPRNRTAKLFLAVAQLFDPRYTASNCGSVVNRVKDLRRSPGGKAKLRERRRRAAARSRAKNR